MTGYELQLHLRYRNSIWNKETEIKINIFHVQTWFYVNGEFYRFLHEDEPNFPLQNNLSLQKKVSGVDKVVNFKYFSRPTEGIKYFSRT